jgi:hypothetical protein
MKDALWKVLTHEVFGDNENQRCIQEADSNKGG